MKKLRLRNIKQIVHDHTVISDQTKVEWLGFGARRPLMQEPLRCSGPDGDADTISLVVLLQFKKKKHKTTYMEHLGSSP